MKINLDDSGGIRIVHALNLASAKLMHAGEEHDIYLIMAESIKNLLPGAMVIVSKIQPDNKNFRIVETFGVEKYFQSIRKLTGIDLFEISFPVDKFSKKQLKAFETRKLNHFPGGIYSITNGALNKIVCKSIEKLTGISDVYGISFGLEEKYYGGMNILITRSMKNSGAMSHETRLAIETLSNLGSSYIQKIRYNEKLTLTNKALKESQEKLIINDFALNASPVAVGLSDLEGRLFYANQAFLQLWGYSGQKEVMGKHIFEISATPENVKSVLQTISRNETFNREMLSVRKDGSEIHLIISATKVYNENAPICLMALFVDITELKLMEERLKELNDEKDRFVSIIAHDLKSPFNAILGFSELLNDDYHNLTDKEKQMYIDVVYKSAKNVFKLLENLLQWSSIRKGVIEIKKENLDLKAHIEECCAIYSAEAQKKKIHLHNNIPENTGICADSNSVKTIFRNLISNAVKFTSGGGTVTIDSVRYNNHVEISVTDNGTGIHPDTLEKLFRVGNKSEPGTNREKGTGLGLILSRDLIEKNGGTIQVESELGKGTRFIVIFPAESGSDGLPGKYPV